MPVTPPCEHVRPTNAKTFFFKEMQVAESTSVILYSPIRQKLARKTKFSRVLDIISFVLEYCLERQV